MEVEQEIALPTGLFALSMSYLISAGQVWVGCTNGHIIIINSKVLFFIIMLLLISLLQTYSIQKDIGVCKKNVDALTVYNGERGAVQMWVGTGDGSIFVYNAKVFFSFKHETITTRLNFA